MPKKIEKYQLGKTLGRGTFSKVKLAVDTTDNSHWAIKIIDRKMVKQENMEAQLKREIAIMKILKHKHVVQLREVLQSSKHIYIVLELITGGELFDRIGTYLFCIQYNINNYLYCFLITQHGYPIILIIIFNDDDDNIIKLYKTT